MWFEDIAYDNDIILNAHFDVPGDMDNAISEDVSPDSTAADPNPPFDPDPLLDPDLPLDEYHEVHRLVMEALDRGDALHAEAHDARDLGNQNDTINDNLDGLADLYRQATTPTYPTSKTSVISATIIIMNMCTIFHVSNKFTDELFRYLSSDLLPTGNKLPGSHYKARHSIQKLGLHYNNVHGCPNGCILFEDEYSLLDTCPKCSSSRWMDGSNSIPLKVIRHFLLIPRLQWMWRS